MAKIAVLAGQEFEDFELSFPIDRLHESGHEVEIVGVDAGAVLCGQRRAQYVTVDRSAAEASPRDYDALLIPGGWSPDHLRSQPDAVGFLRAFVATARPIAAICHAPHLLVEVDAVRGRQMTSWPSLRTDMINAGARWVDREVVEDGPFITSRRPADLEAFSRALLARLEPVTVGQGEPSSRMAR